MKIRFYFVILLSLLTACSFSNWVGKKGSTQLTILHTNDLHTQVQPVNLQGKLCIDNDNDDCMGGYSRLATIIKAEIEKNPDTILVDAGDQLEGSIFYHEYKDRLPIWFMNEMSYNAMTLGTSEFNSGEDTLFHFINSLNFPIVDSNIRVNSSRIQNKIIPYVIGESNGKKIGIIGGISESVDSCVKAPLDVEVIPVIETLSYYIEEMKRKDVKIIILLSHNGFDVDQEIAENVAGIDVIIGGYSHTYLSSSNVESGGTYPVLIMSPENEPVLVVTSGSHGKYLGRIEVGFNSKGQITGWNGIEPITINNKILKDPTVENKILPYVKEVEKLFKGKIGDATETFIGDSSVCRFNECTLGNLVADAVLWTSKSTGNKPADFAIISAGTLNNSIQKGAISTGDAISAVPNVERISTASLTGYDIREMLENSVSKIDNPASTNSRRFPQVSGLRFKWTPKNTIGLRVLSIEIQDRNGQYLPLDYKKTYTVATTDLWLNGADGNSNLLYNAKNKNFEYPVISQGLIQFIKSRGTVEPKSDNRITREL